MEVLCRESDEVAEKLSSPVAEESSPKDKLIAFARAKCQYMRRTINFLNLHREGIELMNILFYGLMSEKISATKV